MVRFGTLLAVKPGDILSTQQTKYRLDALIGRGGMGQVFAATDLAGSSEPIAIKVVSRVLVDETLMARLHREAEAAARIRSEFVPRVLEVSDTDDLEMFLVMERLVGKSLSERLQSDPLPEWPEVAQIGDDVMRGLIDAHAAGVIHRDLKPSNVFLASRGGRTRAMVLDFGVCKMDVVDSERLTETGEAIGTVAYMAPEQIRGASRVDDRADLYAFGVLVFELLSGRLPHDGPSQMAILASKLENHPLSLREASRVAFPAGLDALVAKALARDPTLRFSSAHDLLKAWRRLGAADVAPLSIRTNADGFPRTGLGHASEDDVDADAVDEYAETAYGDGGRSVEPHPTQSGLAHAVRLSRADRGRAAFWLSAGGLAAGVISVGVFFARGPDVAAGAVAGVSSISSARGGVDPPSEVEPVAVDGVEFEDENADVAAGAFADAGIDHALADAGNPALRKSSPRIRVRPPLAAPKTSAPHFTSQPRY